MELEIFKKFRKLRRNVKRKLSKREVEEEVTKAKKA